MLKTEFNIKNPLILNDNYYTNLLLSLNNQQKLIITIICAFFHEPQSSNFACAESYTVAAFFFIPETLV